MITGFVHYVQLSVLVKAIGTGYFLGLLFSIFMLLNSVHGKSTAVVFIRDIIFFLLAAVISFFFTLKYNAGQIRFYILAGELAGFCLFYIFPGASFGNLCRKAVRRISLLLKRIVCFFSLICLRLTSAVTEFKKKHPKKQREGRQKKLRRKAQKSRKQKAGFYKKSDLKSKR